MTKHLRKLSLEWRILLVVFVMNLVLIAALIAFAVR